MVKTHDNRSFKEAAYVILGAITMQGIRRADLRIGEFEAVIGLGLIRQITIHVLKASKRKACGIHVEKI